MYKYLLVGIVAATVWLCACGGVGGRSTPTVPPQPPGNPGSQAAEYIYVTHGTDTAISVFRVDAITGALTEVGGSPFAASDTTVHRQPLCLSGNTCDSVARPVAADPGGKFLYVVSPDENGVRAFTIDAVTGAITPIGTLAFDTGGGPQDIRVDPTGRFLYVDSTESPAGITAFAIDANTGALRSVPGSPFATPELPFLMTATQCCLYLSSTDQPGGVLGYRIDPSSGALTSIAGSPAAPGQSTVAVATDSTGNYLFAVNDTENTMMPFRINTTTGALSSVGQSVAVGDNPTMMTVSPQGFVYVSTGQGISGYALNAGTGTLAPVGGSPTLASGAGAIATDVAGKFVFAVDTANNTVVTFAVDPGGTLRQVSSSAPGPVAYVNLAVVTHK